MRRAQCEITDPGEIVRILDSTTIGRMATVGVDGYPYITPLNFVFYEGKIYFHCSHKGEKVDNIARDPKVCFEADVPLAYLEVAFNRKNSPCNVHQFYQSVIIRGTARIVPDGDFKATVLNALVAKHEGNRKFDPVTPKSPDAIGCAVVEITPVSLTGKADLAQKKDPDTRRRTAEDLLGRGLPGHLKAVEAMGFEIEGSPETGWRIKG